MKNVANKPSHIVILGTVNHKNTSELQNSYSFYANDVKNKAYCCMKKNQAICR